MQGLARLEDDETATPEKHAESWRDQSQRLLEKTIVGT
jgi:hypothetical protein